MWCLRKLLGVALACAVLQGCGKGDTASEKSASQSGSTGKTLKLAFVTNNSSDFWTIARAGTDQAKKDLSNVEVDFQIPGDGTAASQKRIIDDLLARGTDGIATSPIDPTNETTMLNDVAKQTLLFCHDSDETRSRESRIYVAATPFGWSMRKSCPVAE